MSPSQTFFGVAALCLAAGVLAAGVTGGGSIFGVLIGLVPVLWFCNRLDARDRRDARRQDNRKPRPTRKHRP